jgi:hypothetical protein
LRGGETINVIVTHGVDDMTGTKHNGEMQRNTKEIEKNNELANETGFRVNFYQ